MENQEKASLLEEIEQLKRQLQDVTESSLEEAAKREYDVMMADILVKYHAAITEASDACSDAKNKAANIYNEACQNADAVYLARDKELADNKVKLEQDVSNYLEQLREQNRVILREQEQLRLTLQQKTEQLREIEIREEEARIKAEEAERVRIAEEEAKKAAAARPRIRF